MSTEIIRTVDGTEYRVNGEDYAHLSNYRWYRMTASGQAYRREPIPDTKRIRSYMLHREIAGVSSRQIVSFRDGDPTNCTRENLQVELRKNVQRQARHLTRKKGGSSRFRGVALNKVKGKYHAHIRIDGKLKFLGGWPITPEGEIAAARAYDAAARKAWGETAPQNFPPVRKRRPRAEARRIVAERAPKPASSPASAPSAERKPERSNLWNLPFHELDKEQIQQLKREWMQAG